MGAESSGSACRGVRALRRCFGAVLHHLYAVARNGLWDDPAEAVSGSIFTKFEQEADRVNLGKDLAIYLTWRYCYLQCSALFAVVEHVITLDSLRPNRTEFEVIFERAPSNLRQERFDSLITILSWWNVVLGVVWVFSFMLLLAAIFAARPTYAVRRVALSRRLTWASWLVNFVVPFGIFMLFPVRSVVDWSGVEVDICVVAVKATVESEGGVDLAGAMAVLENRDVLTPGVEELARDASDEVVRKWCEDTGSDWGQIFFGNAMECVMSTDSLCREEVCAGLPSNLTAVCASRCLPFSERAEGAGASQAASFLQSLTPCTSASSDSGVFDLPSIGPPEGSPPGGWESGGRPPGVGTFNLTDPLQVFNISAASQQTRSTQTWENASSIIGRLQYIAGLFIAMRSGQILLSAALSVLGGLAEALMNLKALFPGAQEANWVLILTTLQGLPIYCALMAFVLQMLGDHWLAMTCALFAVFSSLSGVTATSSLLLRTSHEERWRFYRKVWVEYGLRFIIGVGALATLRVFLEVNFPELRELLQLQNITRTLSVTLLSYLARKSLLAVAGTDAALSAFVQCELWHDNASEAELDRQRQTVKNLGCLLAPTLRHQASMALRQRKKGGQQDQARLSSMSGLSMIANFSVSELSTTTGPITKEASATQEAGTREASTREESPREDGTGECPTRL